MKTALVVFALKQKLASPQSLTYGQSITDGDCVGYLFEDKSYVDNDPPWCSLSGRTVFMLQHMSGSANHATQRSWIDRAQPQSVFVRPTFIHEGNPKLELQMLFVDGNTAKLREMVNGFVDEGVLDLLEQTLAWNALMQFLPGESDKANAKSKRTSLAKDLKLASVTDKNLANERNLGPQEWESCLRERVAAVSKLIRSS